MLLCPIRARGRCRQGLGYSDKTKEWRDPEEGYRGMETLREKWQGLRGRDGTWIEPMASSWE